MRHRLDSKALTTGFHEVPSNCRTRMTEGDSRLFAWPDRTFSFSVPDWLASKFPLPAYRAVSYVS